MAAVECQCCVGVLAAVGGHRSHRWHSTDCADPAATHTASESEAPAHAEFDAEPEASPQMTPLELLQLTASPQIPNQFQPLAEVEDEDNDYAGLENRAAVGEQSDEEEMAQAGDLHQGKDSGMNSEDEERVFKAKVAAVVRQYKRTNRFHGDTPYYRFTRPEPAVGGPSNSFLHSKVLAYSRAGEFELGSLTSARLDGKSFLTGWNNGAITCRKEIKKRYKQRFGKTSENSPAPQLKKPLKNKKHGS